MARRTETTITVVGTLTGSFWWPIGEPWEKEIRESRRYVARATSYAYRSETASLRDLILEITNDGDSSAACLLSSDTEIKITRTHYTLEGSDYRRTRQVVRFMPITAFPSVADCVAQGDR